jgi:hypothetical protein
MKITTALVLKFVFTRNWSCNAGAVLYEIKLDASHYHSEMFANI